MPFIILIVLVVVTYKVYEMKIKNQKKVIDITDDTSENKKSRRNINMKIKLDKKKTIILLIVVFVLIVLFASIKTVPTGSVGVKTRFGAVQKTMINEGINFKAPFIEQIVLVNCKTQKIDTTSESSTRDMQTVNVTIAVNYNVNKDTANLLYQEVGLNYEDVIIEPAMLESIKSSMAQYTAEELITKRSEVSDKIKETLISKISERGFTITGFNITNVEFSSTYNQAIEQKAVAQQQVETAKANLEKQQIDNQKKISQAEAEAEVMRLQNSQITDKTLELKELENQKAFIEKWNGILPTTMLSDAVTAMFGLNK